MSDSIDALNVEITGTTQSLNDALEESIKHLGSFSDIADAAKEMISGPAGMITGAIALAKVLGELDEAYAEYQKTNLLYEAAIEGSGKGTEEFRKSVDESVLSMMQMTGASDDVAKAQAVTLMSTGRTADEIRKMTIAAEGMANVTGTSLETALTQLNMTFSGTSGRLSRLNPELKDLTKEQLVNGNAVDALYVKYAKFSDVLADSADVSLKKYKATWDEVFGVLGETASDAITPVRDMLQRMGEAILDTNSNWSAFATGVNNVTNVLKQLLLSLVGKGNVWEAIAKIGNTAKSALTATAQETDIVVDKMILLGGIMEKVLISAKTSDAARRLLESQANAIRVAEAEEIALQVQRVYDETAAYAARLDETRGAAMTALYVKWKTTQDDMSVVSDAGEQARNDALAASLQKQATAHTTALAEWAARVNAASAEDSVVTETETTEYNKALAQRVVDAQKHYKDIDDARQWDIDQEKKRVEAWKLAGEEVEKSFASFAKNQYLKTMNEMGTAIKDGATGWEAMGAGVVSFVTALVDAAPQMMTNIGIALLPNPATLPIGIALIAAGGLLEISNASGFTDAAASELSKFGNKVSSELGKFGDWLGFAEGTDYAPGGLAWVGENGPELMDVPRGARITPADQSRTLSASSGDVHFHSPTELNPIQASRMLTQTKRRLAWEAQ
jgi:hypothetical protein